ncbi:hypothetical protein [Plastoroseomonas arctica]|uniref:Uncharacterized protein n=1 Tax=Plastoroseomonas arctica TaxID=1509237 RepID=A0AAF1K645_9PROT|nr:hypothetical protein [Plastoroseomonas arctica]MBR0657200.1 hypothetical protein [Plastoroseomonas arctica]
MSGRAAPLAPALLAHLLRDFACAIGHDGTLHRGIAAAPGEATAGAFETALAAEALTHPALARTEPALAGALVECLRAMAAGGTLVRAIGKLPLVVVSDDPERLDIRTATHEFFGNLREGVLHQRMRDATGPGVKHGGAMIEFRLWGRAHCLDVEDAIVEARVDRAPGLVRLTQVSAIVAPGRFGGAPREVGRLSYTYEIRAASGWLGVTVRFEPAPGVAPRRLRLITACDGISDGESFTEAAVDGAPVPLAAGMVTLCEGTVAAVTLRQAGAAGLRLELRPAAGAVVNAKLSVRPDAAAHWLVLRHGPEGADAVTVAEERLLLDHEIADPRADQRGRALGRARGRGVALLAVARRLALAEDGLAPVPEAERAALRGFAATLLAELRATPALAALDAGFLVLAERALGEASSPARLLALERREALGDGLERGLYGTALDQAAAIMALAELGEAGAVARALAALGIVTAPVALGGRRGMAELPAIAGMSAEDAASLALLVRALACVARARGAGALVLDPTAAARATRLGSLYTGLLDARLRGDGDGLAVADSALGGPASGAGQAATLGALAGRG